MYQQKHTKLSFVIGIPAIVIKPKPVSVLEPKALGNLRGCPGFMPSSERY